MHVRTLPLPIILQDMEVLNVERKVRREIQELHGKSAAPITRPRRRR